jgi:hypothetical protein
MFPVPAGKDRESSAIIINVEAIPLGFQGKIVPVMFV